MFYDNVFTVFTLLSVWRGFRSIEAICAGSPANSSSTATVITIIRGGVTILLTDRNIDAAFDHAAGETLSYFNTLYYSFMQQSAKL